MSWSDDTRCLFCDGKLPLFRKLAQGQFCSKAHQEAYWKEQDQLAVEVLHRTHDALQAYKTAAPIESILGPAVVPEPVAKPVAADFIPDIQGLQRQPGNRAIAPRQAVIAAAEPVEYEIHLPAAKPVSAAQPMQHASSEVKVTETLATLVPCDAVRAIAPGLMPIPESAGAIEAQVTLHTPEWQASSAVDLAWGGLAALREMAAKQAVAQAPVAEPVAFATEAVRDVPLVLTPRGDVLERMELEAFPMGDTQLALAEPKPRMESGFRNASEFVAFRPGDAERPGFVGAAVEHRSLAASAGMLALSGNVAARDWSAPLRGNVASLEARVAPVAIDAIRMPAPAAGDPMVDLLSSVGCAPMRPLPMLDVKGTENTPAGRPVSYQAFACTGVMRLPDSATRPVLVRQPEIRIKSDQLLRLNWLQLVRARQDLRLRPGFVAEPMQGEAILPVAKLQPLKPQRAPGVAGAILEQQASARRMTAGVAEFWNHAPRDLKMLLFAVPLALGLAFHPSLPKVSLQAPQTDPKAVTGQFQNVLNTQLASLRKSMAERAAVGLDENFRQGLDNWMSHSGSTAEWSFDQAGFVQPGRVALYQPSLGLTDYEFQFLGAIDKGALSWVTRAVDFQNYYVVKLVVLKGGPIPEMGIVRYAVINGKPVDRVDTPVTFQARTDSLYRVSMVMEKDHYALTIQGQMIDSWKEPRLKRGGVGFFTNRGEESRIGWVQITHQYDMLGRFFAYLAP